MEGAGIERFIDFPEETLERLRISNHEIDKGSEGNRRRVRTGCISLYQS